MLRIIRDHQHCPASAQGAVIALGNFDGVHAGHRSIINQAKDIAQTIGAPAAVMTFEPHPREFFAREKSRLRMYPLSQKLELLEEAGIELVFMMRFNKTLASTSAQGFVEDILHKHLKARHVVTGFNFAFGKGREGNTQTLAEYAQKAGFGFTACPQVQIDGKTVSSSAIREFLAGGDIEKADQLLGEPYRLRGRVRPGAQRGRTLGFHTANIAIAPLFKPRYGVYAVRARVGSHGTWHQAIANIGVKPTFNPSEPLLEVHIFDFDQMIYGKILEVEFLEFLRPEMCFVNVEALVQQIELDIAHAKEVHYEDGK